MTGVVRHVLSCRYILFTTSLFSKLIPQFLVIRSNETVSYVIPNPFILKGFGVKGVDILTDGTFQRVSILRTLPIITLSEFFTVFLV